MTDAGSVASLDQFMVVSKKVSGRAGILGGVVGVALLALHFLIGDELSRATALGMPLLAAALTSSATVALSLYLAPQWYFGGRPGRLRPGAMDATDFHNACFYLAISIFLTLATGCMFLAVAVTAFGLLPRSENAADRNDRGARRLDADVREPEGA
ncbi:MAG TPA: hypothetical protein VGN57_22950 [Pirellulaceae bacterium]|nr:hypothetical protein [Pirellulaceae bacterium]